MADRQSFGITIRDGGILFAVKCGPICQLRSDRLVDNGRLQLRESAYHIVAIGNCLIVTAHSDGCGLQIRKVTEQLVHETPMYSRITSSRFIQDERRILPVRKLYSHKYGFIVVDDEGVRRLNIADCVLRTVTLSHRFEDVDVVGCTSDGNVIMRKKRSPNYYDEYGNLFVSDDRVSVDVVVVDDGIVVAYQNGGSPFYVRRPVHRFNLVELCLALCRKRNITDGMCSQLTEDLKGRL